MDMTLLYPFGGRASLVRARDMTYERDAEEVNIAGGAIWVAKRL